MNFKTKLSNLIPNGTTFLQKVEFAGKISVVVTAFAFPLSTTLMNILFFASAVLSVASGNLRKRFSMVANNRVAILFLVFFALFVIGLIYTSAPIGYALSRFSKYDKLLFMPLLMPLFVEEKWRHYAINAFLIAIGIALFCSYLKMVGLIHYGWWYGNVEIFKGHIAFDFLMGFAAYLIMLKIAETKYRYYQLAWLVFLLLITFDVIFMSKSRTGYIVLICLIALFFLQKFSWKGLLVSFAMLLILLSAAFTFSQEFKTRIYQISSDVTTYTPDTLSSVGLRMSFVKNGVRVIKKHPVFGSGTGSLKHEYAKLKPAPFFIPNNPHNQYIDITVQLGIIGLFTMLILFGLQLWNSRYLMGNMGYVAQAVVLSIAIGSLANSWIMDTTQGHFYVYFSALTFAALISSKKKLKRNV